MSCVVYEGVSTSFVELNKVYSNKTTQNALDPTSVTDLEKGHDTVLSAMGPGGSAVDVIVKAAHALTDSLSRAGILRLIVVGDAGTLEVVPGVLLVDSPN